MRDILDTFLQAQGYRPAVCRLRTMRYDRPSPVCTPVIECLDLVYHDDGCAVSAFLALADAHEDPPVSQLYAILRHLHHDGLYPPRQRAHGARFTDAAQLVALLCDTVLPGLHTLADAENLYDLLLFCGGYRAARRKLERFRAAGFAPDKAMRNLPALILLAALRGDYAASRKHLKQHGIYRQPRYDIDFSTLQDASTEALEGLLLRHDPELLRQYGTPRPEHWTLRAERELGANSYPIATAADILRHYRRGANGSGYQPLTP